MDWFRWHHGSVTDPKFQVVARKAGASLPDVLAVWAYILEQASANEDRGCFGCVDAEALDVLFNFPDTETRTADILKSLEARGLTVDGRIAQWEKRQPKREREDNSTERVRKHRERHETPRNANESQETPREEEKRVEKKKEGERATRLPSNFDPRPEPEAEAGIDRAKELANFRDYWSAKPGKDGLKLDWQATWRTWARKAYRKPETVAQSRPNQDAEETRRMLDERTRGTKTMPPEIRQRIDSITRTAH